MMTLLPRPFSAILLALLLSVTSVTMAVARGQSRVAGEIVICSGYGFITIKVDQHGNEVDQVHLCPDMALGLIVAIDHAPLIVERPAGRASDLILVEPSLLQSRIVPQARARSPPVSV
jgi:hypothetical protein